MACAERVLILRACPRGPPAQALPTTKFVEKGSNLAVMTGDWQVNTNSGTFVDTKTIPERSSEDQVVDFFRDPPRVFTKGAISTKLSMTHLTLANVSQ